MATQDAAAAALVLQSARDHGVGSHTEMLDVVIAGAEAGCTAGS